MSDRIILEKFKQILTVSKSVKIDRIQRALGIDEEIFDRNIFQWAEQFGFKIDREYLITTEADIDEFIQYLDKHFTFYQYDENEEQDEDLPSFQSNSSNIEGVPNQPSEYTEDSFSLVPFRGTEIPKSEVNVIRTLESSNIFKTHHIPNQFVNVRELEGEKPLEFTTTRQRISGISLSNTGLRRFPELLTDLTSLKVLDLSGNHLKTFPNSIGNLKSLEILNLKKNELTEIPAGLKNLTSLEKLLLSRNNIKNIPEFLYELNSLKYLDLSLNPLTNITEYILKRKFDKIPLVQKYRNK